MKASEARALAKQRATTLCIEHKAIFDKIIDSIKKALRTQECYEITWYDSLPAPVIKMLENEEYSVKWESFRNETTYTISWAE